MSYFAALLARRGDDWKGKEIDPDALGDLDALVDVMADESVDSEPVLLVVEREDEWFALVRVDGGDAESKVFVSDIPAATSTAVGRVLLPEVVDATDEDDLPVPSGPDLDIVEDLGTSPDDLMDLCEKGTLPADALTSVAERAGCVDALERLR